MKKILEALTTKQTIIISAIMLLLILGGISGVFSITLIILLLLVIILFLLNKSTRSQIILGVGSAIVSIYAVLLSSYIVEFIYYQPVMLTVISVQIALLTFFLSLTYSVKSPRFGIRNRFIGLTILSLINALLFTILCIFLENIILMMLIVTINAIAFLYLWLNMGKKIKLVHPEYNTSFFTIEKSDDLLTIEQKDNYYIIHDKVLGIMANIFVIKEHLIVTGEKGVKAPRYNKQRYIFKKKDKIKNAYPFLIEQAEIAFSEKKHFVLISTEKSLSQTIIDLPRGNNGKPISFAYITAKKENDSLIDSIVKNLVEINVKKELKVK